jgi:hypothetical protein
VREGRNDLKPEVRRELKDWLIRVDQEPDLACIPLSFEDRTGHLPQLPHDVIARLRLDAGTKALISDAAAIHGDLRRKQGYTVAMAVEVPAIAGLHFYRAAQKREGFGVQHSAS